MRRPYTLAVNFGKAARLRYIEPVANEIAKPCAVNFWTFAIPAMLGTTGAQIAGHFAAKLYKDDHAETQKTALLATRFGAFWLISGFAWIVMCKRNGASK
jgi:hypothetical protein